MSSTRDRALRIYWIVSLCAVVFAYGIAVGQFKIFPYEVLRTAGSTARELIRFPRHTLRIAPEKYFALSPPEGTGVTQHVAGKPNPGITLMTGFFEGSNGIRLLDLDGKILNEWRISFNEVWPDAPHLEDQPHDWDTALHGSMLLPNGDVITTFEYLGLLRMDRCGQLKWKLSRETSHLFDADAEGNLWIPSRILRNEPTPKYPKIPAPFYEDFVLKVSPDGKVLQEISILGAIYEARYEGVLFANGQHIPEMDVLLSSDFTHLNDVEILTPELAPSFPMFEAGDLLVSLRNLDLLMVISPMTGHLKWTRTGPYLRQHDPDFLANGKISVLDNRRDNGGGKLFGGSRILGIDPANGDVTTLYGSRKGEYFYTEEQGTHQWLQNGNLLITETNNGHAFEVDPDGKVVWSYVNRWKNGSVGKISQATRYPDHYVSQSFKEPCGGK